MSESLNQSTVNTPPIDAATVILMRDATPGIEVLLLCRANSRTVMNSAWVFPGGKLESSDFENNDTVLQQLAERPGASSPQQLLNEADLSDSQACALFTAACRETHEETGVQLSADQLHPWSRWVTPNEPSLMKKRFDARFFAAALPQGAIATHDGSEATDSKWLTPKRALQQYVAHEMALAPPQIMTLIALCDHSDTASCLAFAAEHATYCIAPEVIKHEDGRTLIYPGNPRPSDPQQQMPGPTSLTWRDGHFEPENGFGTLIE